MKETEDEIEIPKEVIVDQKEAIGVLENGKKLPAEDEMIQSLQILDQKVQIIFQSIRQAAILTGERYFFIYTLPHDSSKTGVLCFPVVHVCVSPSAVFPPICLFIFR